MNADEQASPLPNETQKPHELNYHRGKEKRKRWWWVLLAVAGFLIILCLAAGAVIAIVWARHNAQHNARPQVLWRYHVGSTIASAPLVTDGVAYFGTLEQTSPAAFYAVDTATGQALWHTPTGDQVFHWLPAVVEDKVFFATDDGNFQALAAQTGAEQWRFGPDQRQDNLPDDPDCRRCALKFRLPAVADGIIYVAGHDGHLYALDAHSGAEQWRFPVGGLVGDAPAIVDGRVYAGSDDGHIYVLDAATGDLQQKLTIGESVSSVLVDGNLLYASGEKTLIALNRHTGQEQWRAHRRWSEMGSFSGRLHMDGERLYLMATDRLTAIDKANGDPAWQFNDFQGGVFGEPAVAEGLIAVGDSASYLYLLDAASGELIQRINMVRHDPSSEISFTAEFVFDPTIVDGVIYFGWYDYLYAIKVPD